MELTKEQREAMVAVKGGADVYSYAIAMRLREVQRASPELIDIGRAMDPPTDGAVPQPYFGAVLTAAGKAAIAERAMPAERDARLAFQVIVNGEAKRFGREVKRRRRAMELSRAQLGARAGYSAGVIARVEAGRGWIPREMADHIARALNVKRTAIMFRRKR